MVTTAFATTARQWVTEFMAGNSDRAERIDALASADWEDFCWIAEAVLYSDVAEVVLPDHWVSLSRAVDPRLVIEEVDLGVHSSTLGVYLTVVIGIEDISMRETSGFEVAVRYVDVVLTHLAELAAACRRAEQAPAG